VSYVSMQHRTGKSTNKNNICLKRMWLLGWATEAVTSCFPLSDITGKRAVDLLAPSTSDCNFLRANHLWKPNSLVSPTDVTKIFIMYKCFPNSTRFFNGIQNGALHYVIPITFLNRVTCRFKECSLKKIINSFFLDENDVNWQISINTMIPL
jgi:hypothetical protein